ncbi:hypothetical protein DV735_g2147, partial [Chaetothyriales sp. CBS 134920]
MATATVTEFATITHSVTVSAASTSSTLRATPQGGVFEGLNPTHYDTKNPITLFVIQAVIVILLTRLIHFPLTYLRQPRVIAEVITGILLGPSVCGRIPGFTKTIFPTESMPAFTLVANLGLVLFLFLVGLEVDLRQALRNWRIAVSVAAAGMALPFGLGAAIAYGLYHQFRDDEGVAPISFGVYLIFIGVAMAITAFPVLCRILTSLKLLGTNAGVIVLSAGIGNDVVGWILLALCVALVNSGAGLTALWILLVLLGYALFLAFIVRPVFIWILKRTGSLANGPSQSVVALTLLLVLISAFFTQIIGVHPIFGAFMIGILCPHDGGFAIKLTEKIEDLVSVLLLPLYFTISGLNTNLGLLNSGITWAYVVGVTSIAFFGKVIGTTLAARLNGLVWRESLTIGILMSCKGVVELIVLNIGYSAKILSTRTFTIFVVMTLLTTFATTPLTIQLYPPWYQQKLAAWKGGKIDWNGNPVHPRQDGGESEEDSEEGGEEPATKGEVARKVLVYLRLDSLPSILTLVSLFASTREVDQPHAPELQSDLPIVRKNSKAILPALSQPRPVRFHGLRLMELTERESSVMKASELVDYANRDAVIKAFGTFGQSRDIPVGGQIAIVPERSFPGTLFRRARDLRSDFVLLPWSETGTMSEHASVLDEKTGNPLTNREFTRLVSETYDKLHGLAHVGVFIDSSVFDRQTNTPGAALERPALQRTGTGLSTNEKEQAMVEFRLPESGRQQIVAVYQHGPDDLYGVRLALQLARHNIVDLKIIKTTSDEDEDSADEDHHDLDFQVATAEVAPDVKRRLRIEESKGTALEAAIAAVNEPSAGPKLVIVGRGSKGVSAGGVTPNSSDSRVLGPLAMAVLQTLREKASRTSLMVVQARRDPHDLSSKTYQSIRATTEAFYPPPPPPHLQQPQPPQQRDSQIHSHLAHVLSRPSVDLPVPAAYENHHPNQPSITTTVPSPTDTDIQVAPAQVGDPRPSTGWYSGQSGGQAAARQVQAMARDHGSQNGGSVRLQQQSSRESGEDELRQSHQESRARMAQQLATKPPSGAPAPAPAATQSTSRNKEDVRELDFNQLVQRYEELQAKYSKVKRYYFEREAQVTQLQNTVATQRLSMSKTSLDDAQYQQRFERLSGAINNLAFNIRKDWKHVVPWLRAVCNHDAHTTGTKEMTAVGRACISRWLAEEVFDRVFHPALPPEISRFLKTTEKALRRQGQSGNVPTEEQRDDLTTKITTWRLTTMEGLSDHLNTQLAAQNQDSLTNGLTEELTLFLKSHLNDPAPAGLHEGVGTIVQLAINIAANIPLESRDVCVQYFLPGEPVNETYMKLETGMTPLAHPGLDERLERALSQQQRRLGGGGEGEDGDDGNDRHDVERDSSGKAPQSAAEPGPDKKSGNPGGGSFLSGFGSKKRQRKAVGGSVDPAEMSADERVEYMHILGIPPLLPGEGKDGGTNSASIGVGRSAAANVLVKAPVYEL